MKETRATLTRLTDCCHGTPHALALSVRDPGQRRAITTLALANTALIWLLVHADAPRHVLDLDQLSIIMRERRRVLDQQVALQV